MTAKIKRVGSQTLERPLLYLILTAWIGGCVAILAHRVFVTNDSLSNYAHVWYVSKVFWAGDGIPFHFPEIGHGDALAFPYGFLPWFTAALLHPLFGDWITTLWLVLGGAGVVLAALWAFPELRRPLPAAFLLANPLMVEAVLLGQLPFLWATAPWFLAIGMWRRGNVVLAVLFAAIAQGTHPAVVLPLAGLTVLGRLIFEPRRPGLVVAYAISVLLATPAIVLVLISPVVEDSSFVSLIANFVGTVGIRAGVVLMPFAIIWLERKLSRRSMLALVATAALLNVVLVPIRDTGFAWHALARTPDTQLVPYLESSTFHEGATYRLLRIADGKVGMYQLIRHGGRLDSEFFPESIDRRSWPSAAEYQAFLVGRHVDYVLIYYAYDVRYGTNEHELLNELVSQGCASLDTSEAEFDLYHVQLQCR